MEIKTYACAQVTDACFEKILFDRPLHQVVVYRRLGHLLVLLNRLVVVALKRCEICHLEEELVGQGLGVVT